MKVYISGAITGTEGYLQKFAKAEKYFTDKGFTVINPAKISAELPGNTTHAEYMELSLVLLKMADGIALFPDWEHSTGATLEKCYAETMEKTVWFIPQTILEKM